jgi:hypothetical protein
MLVLCSGVYANDTGSLVDFVTRFYQTVLNREPDSGGLNNWVNHLNSGRKSGADIAKGFIFSDEFQNRDVDNSKYIEILYRAFFNREGDSGGVANWMNKLEDGESRAFVLNGFLNSQEFNELCNKYGIKPNFNAIINFVTRFYQKVLDREPDSGGLDNWVHHLSGGTKSGADIAKGFIFSNEFQNRNVDNSKYIEILYRAFFNREGDSGGVANWMGRLQNGESRGFILNGFLNSQEFANLCFQYGIRATNSSTYLSNGKLIIKNTQNINLDLSKVKTIKCSDISVGDIFKINGIAYEVVDDGTIRNDRNDYQHICTSHVDDMYGLFLELSVPEEYIYPHIRVNGYTSSYDYDGYKLRLDLLDLTELQMYHELFKKDSM